MTTGERPENRLAREKSPYLLQHARNPVDWFPFGPEALEKARSEDKPIFLSIGYSTCHWCHVMERESFENTAVAAVMNEHFVNIKIDREERPDVDQVYMQAVVAMTGQGGWPLSAWLTPDLEPFFCGTYFPPDSRWGRPGFTELLLGIARTWSERRGEITRSSEKLMETLRRTSGDGGELSDDVLARCARDLETSFDATWGGFGGAPKFPRPSALAFTAHRASRVAWASAPMMLDKTLEMMWRGGMYDHVGGGFSRYSTDRKWLVPHFEKMLYDNAMLVHAYLDAHLRSDRTDFADVVRDVLAFVEREMTHARGGFYSAQDADSEGVEGKFYVFTPDDLEAAVGADDAAFLTTVHATSDGGNFEGSNILWWPRSPEEVAMSEGITVDALMKRHRDVRGRLYEWREQRIRPGLDDKVLTSWNGLMIGACARAGAALGDPAYVEMAERAATFIEEDLRDADGTLLRRWRDDEARYEASLDDHTFFAHGLLDLFGATGSSRWLARAVELLDEIEARYADADGGYWFATASDDLVVRMKESYDGALPSGNSMQALLLTRLGALLDRDDLREKAAATVRVFATSLSRVPEGYPLMLCALAEADEPPRTLFVVGDPESEAFRADLLRAHRALMPGRLVIPVLNAERDALESLGVPLHGKTAGAWLCEDAACKPW